MRPVLKWSWRDLREDWWKYIKIQWQSWRFNYSGELAPAGQLFKEFGFTVENVVKNVEAVF